MQQRLGLEYFDEQFDINDLGFLEHNDRYGIRSAFVLTRSGLGWARENQLDIRGFLHRSVSAELFNGAGIFFANRTLFRNLSALTLRGHFFPEYYDDLNSFGNGTYRIEERAEVMASWESDTTRPVSLLLGGGWREEDLGSDSVHGETAVTWRPSDRFNVIFKVRYDDRDGWLLHQQDDLFAAFSARQWAPKLSADYFLSARQQFRVALQWVGIRARENEFFRVPATPGDLLATSKPVGAGFRPSYDFSVSQFSFQARYRWEIAPLSEVFLVYTRQADQAAALGDDTFEDVFRAAWHRPLVNVLVFKLRYRLGS